MATVILNIDEELNEEQTAEWAKRVNTATDQFLADVEAKQLYYVKSPMAKNKILGYTSPSGYSFVLFELSHLSKTMFSQSELAQVQEENPGLNIEFLKVRVEDYDNE